MVLNTRGQAEAKEICQVPHTGQHQPERVGQARNAVTHHLDPRKTQPVGYAPIARRRRASTPLTGANPPYALPADWARDVDKPLMDFGERRG
jgi:hypothetical protein